MGTNVLILCTHNSARSVLGEGMLNHWAGRLGKDVRAFSAGSAPSGRINPLALEALGRAGVDTSGLRSKSWDEFAAPAAPPIDLVITVCGNAAGEACPLWPGGPATAHWGVDDPAAVDGDEDMRRRAYLAAFAVLRRRVELLVALPMDKLDRLAAQREVRAIGSAGAQ